MGMNTQLVQEADLVGKNHSMVPGEQHVLSAYDTGVFALPMDELKSQVLAILVQVAQSARTAFQDCFGALPKYCSTQLPTGWSL